jgi:signal transduction histidine kinase
MTSELPPGPPPRGRRPSPAAVSALLLLLLVGVNGFAIAGIVAARRDARQAAAQDLRLEAAEQARAVEAYLATLRRQLVQLTRLPVLRELVAHRGDAPAPSAAGAEPAIRHFLAEHPAVAALAVRDRAGAALLLAARDAAGPLILPLTSDPPAPIADPGLLVAQLPVPGGAGERGLLEVWLSLAEVVAAAAPGAAPRLALQTAGESANGEQSGTPAAAVAPVNDPSWPTPLHLTLELRGGDSRLLASLTQLESRFGWTVLLNVGVIVSTLLLGALALRQVQRAAELQAENRQQERLRELERRMLHSERLASVGRMAAGVAHEVNNPLEGMSNYLTLLAEDLAAGQVEQARALVPRVREGLDRVAAVVRGMLALSDPGRTGKRRLDLREPVQQALSFVAGQRAYRDLELDVVLAEVEVPVHGDPTTLGQLALNLLLNAAQAQPDGGAVAVRCEPGGAGAVLRVGDSGPGFSPEALARAFEPFHSTRGSTGLGLAMCHSIARDHGGTLRIANRPGGGAEVTLELPLAAAGAAPRAPEAA